MSLYVISNFDSPRLYNLSKNRNYMGMSFCKSWMYPQKNMDAFNFPRELVSPLKILNSVQNFFAVVHNLFQLPIFQGWSLFSGKTLETYEWITEEISHLQCFPCFWSGGSKFIYRACMEKAATMFFVFCFLSSASGQRCFSKHLSQEMVSDRRFRM